MCQKTMGNPCIVIYNLANTSARINVKEAERHTHYPGAWLLYANSIQPEKLQDAEDINAAK